MVNETLTEQLKKLLSKVNSIQGQQLTFAQRLKALEEKKPFENIDSALLIKIAKYLGFIPKEEEEPVEELKEALAEIVIADKEEVDPEVLESLDELIKDD